MEVEEARSISKNFGVKISLLAPQQLETVQIQFLHIKLSLPCHSSNFESFFSPHNPQMSDRYPQLLDHKLFNFLFL